LDQRGQNRRHPGRQARPVGRGFQKIRKHVVSTTFEKRVRRSGAD
jgi:hypothetical protein